MSTPFLGEMRWFSFGFAPKGWALCNGQTVPISQNQALFALLGTTYGGNGISTFGLPNMQGRTPMHRDNAGTYPQGAAGGEQNHTLTLAELADHTHPGAAKAAAGTSASPTGAYWAASTEGDTPYSTAAPDGEMNPACILAAGGGQAHNNMQPYLVLELCIALQGIFPSRN